MNAEQPPRTPYDPFSDLVALDHHNPYASPSAAPELTEPDVRGDLKTLAWTVIYAWERLRVGYLLWLSLVSVAVLTAIGFDRLPVNELGFWAMLTAGFVGANVCFTAGHVFEVFVGALGMPTRERRWLRGAVFVLGTLLATLLTALVLLDVTGVLG